jgi:hypothetical protein
LHAVSLRVGDLTLLKHLWNSDCRTLIVEVANVE